MSLKDMRHSSSIYAITLNDLASDIHNLNKNWWINIKTGEKIERNIGELLMLVTSELAEALEGHRKNLQDTHLPEEKMFNVEIADAMIRLFDIAGGMGINLGHLLVTKLQYNAHRADHKVENRLKDDGKKY